MPTYQASAASRANAEALWAAWTDVSNWSTFEHIEAAAIDGEFRPGATITSKARGFPSSNLTVTHVESPTLWVDESRAPGMRMTFEHVIEPGANGASVTERVIITGPLGRLIGPLLRRRLEALLAESVSSLASRAESDGASGDPVAG